MDPKQLALQLKPQLEAKGYTVDAQGNVRYPPSGTGIHPPWAWMQAFPEADIKLKLPGSDPSSAWHSMYASGGPFTHQSAWDQSNGTYEGRIDWGTLLGTIGVGSMFAAPALAALAGGGGPASSIPTAFGSTAVDTVSSAAPGAAAGGAAAGAGAAGTVANYLKLGAPIAGAITNRLGQPSSGGNGVSSLDPALMSQLTTLLDMAQKRVASAQPVHDAAMSMAMRMAPTYADSPRLTQAIQNSTTPAPTGNYSAATLAALKKMAGQ